MQSALVPARPNPLLTVLGWELRRALGSRATRIIAALLFGVCLLLLRVTTQSVSFSASTNESPTGLPVHHMVSGSLAWTSLWGLADLLPLPALVFGQFLPFVTTDGVSLDVKRRTHELLMTTSLPSWAYVWGRYLASMLIALGMACVFLLAMVVMALALHLVQPDDYPALDQPGAVAIWAVIVLPSTLLLGSLGFALGALLPRRSNLIKVGILFTWFVCGMLLPGYLQHLVQQDPAFVQGHTPAWWTAYATWEPTSIPAGSAIFLHQFFDRLYAILDNATLSNTAVQQQAHTLEGQMPDLAAFTGAHLIWVAVGLAAVVSASLAFRRFRNVVA